MLQTKILKKIANSTLLPSFSVWCLVAGLGFFPEKKEEKSTLKNRHKFPILL